MPLKRTSRRRASLSRTKPRRTKSVQFKSGKQTSRSQTLKDLSCPIVGIGGSAGGFEAAVELLRHLPPKTGMAFVIVQHLDPHHASRLPKLLSKVTAMPVVELAEPTTPRPNTVYVQPPNECVIVKEGVLKLIRRTQQLNLAIDHFFESLAEELGSRAIGVILSGSGTDGTAGLRAIKADGGLTFAQSEESAKFDAMPRSAIRAGFVDAALPPREIAQEIRRVADHRYTRPMTDAESAKTSSPVTSSMWDGALLYQTAIVDLTERKRAEQTLRKSEEHLRAIINQSNAGIASCDLTGRFLFANQRFREMLGYTDSELAARTIFTVTHPDDVAVTKRRFGEMVQRRQPIEMEKRYIRKDRSLMWVNVCDTPVLDAAGKPVSAVAVAIDITERKRAEAALQRSNELLEERVRQRTHKLRVANEELEAEIERRKGLEGEILAVSDREQQRLGQELHDGLCQHLTAVAFMARSIALRLKNHRVIEVKDIEKIAQLVNDAATDTRNLSRALHRVDVDAAGLVAALEDLVDREIWKTPCRLEVKPSFHIEDDMAAAHLYRIAREAVINANKHAQAREVVIELERWRRGMVLRVTDDGVGFSNAMKLKQGLGLHIMNYRAQLIGGRLEIDSPKGGGTRVSCYLPNNAFQSKERKNA